MSDTPSKIAVCMIVKDGERTLEVALRSVRAYVDEINIYDTDSTDGTLGLLDRLSRQERVEALGGQMAASPGWNRASLLAAIGDARDKGAKALEPSVYRISRGRVDL